MNEIEFENFLRKVQHENARFTIEYFISMSEKQRATVIELLLSVVEPMTPEQKESQRRSFVYGTTKLSNSEITEELVNDIGEKYEQKRI